jgi:hypothetical protein
MREREEWLERRKKGRKEGRKGLGKFEKKNENEIGAFWSWSWV